MGYTLFVKLHNSWPAIHRVLLALRDCRDKEEGSLAHALEALRALDGDKGAT